MDNFKERANQFFKNEKIEGNNRKEEILSFYDLYYNNLASKEDENIICQAAKIISSGITTSSDIEEKIIEMLMFSSMFEEEGWSDYSTNPYLIDVDEVRIPIETRELEIDEIDEGEYIELFGGNNWDSEANKREIEYCLQDIKDDENKLMICFNYVVQKNIESILDRASYRDVKSDLIEFLDIVL